MHLQSLQSCLALCGPVDYSPPGSCVSAIISARILEWVSFPLPGALPNPAIGPTSLGSSAMAGGSFTTSAIYKAQEEGGETGVQNPPHLSFMNLAKLMLHFQVLVALLEPEIAQQIWCTWLLPLWSSRFSGARR